MHPHAEALTRFQDRVIELQMADSDRVEHAAHLAVEDARSERGELTMRAAESILQSHRERAYHEHAQQAREEVLRATGIDVALGMSARQLDAHGLTL